MSPLKPFKGVLGIAILQSFNIGGFMQLNLTFYCDPSHGWLEVPLDLVRDLGISDDISQYSYRDGNFAYLEEDGDLSTFLDKAKAKGWNIAFTEKHTNHDSPIRLKARYK